MPKGVQHDPCNLAFERGVAGWYRLCPDRADIYRRIENAYRRVNVIKLGDQVSQLELVVLDEASQLGPLSRERVQHIRLVRI